MDAVSCLDAASPIDQINELTVIAGELASLKQGRRVYAAHVPGAVCFLTPRDDVLAQTKGMLSQQQWPCPDDGLYCS